MHVTHYLVGLVFYTSTSFAMALARESVSRVQTSLGWILFSWASLEQHLAHSHLASLRSSDSSDSYLLPTARYFRFVACPHYFFELFIYISLLIQAPDWTQTCIVLWVLTDLHFAAEQQWKWYHDKFEKSEGGGAKGKGIVPKDWKRWIPGVV
jgi:3-oxo-5-alpha-steroid 4-dehydrogenase 3